MGGLLTWQRYADSRVWEHCDVQALGIYRSSALTQTSYVRQELT